MKKLAEILLPIKTTNPNNGSQGISWYGRVARSKKHAEQRSLALLMLAHTRRKFASLLDAGGLTIDLMRIAPSEGLDEEDNLRASLKWVKDGTADALGLKNDRDKRITWTFDQRRGKEYGVLVTFYERVAHASAAE